MSLLKKHIAANPIAGTRSIEYVTLLNIVPSAPVTIDGDVKPKVYVLVQDADGAQAAFYLFKEACAGLPSFIPKGGVEAMLTLQESKDINPTTNAPYINAVALGVKGV